MFPKNGLNLLLAFIISSVLAICGAILADVLDTTVRDPEQAARALDTTVIGTLPTVREMRRIGPITLNGPAAAEASGQGLANRVGQAVVRYRRRGDLSIQNEKSRAPQIWIRRDLLLRRSNPDFASLHLPA